MVEQDDNISVAKYLNMLFRHKLVLFLSVLLIGVGGTAIIFQLPNIYKSSTLILVEPQKIPENYVRSTITSDVEARMNTLTQQVMSRTRLQKIIDEFALYKNEKGIWETIEKRIPKSIGEKIPWVINKLKEKQKTKQSTSKEDIITLMRKSIIIDVRNSGGHRQRSSAFAISYTGKNPQVVMTVTNKLASLFIEENLKLRELQVKGTTEFLERELQSVQAKLEEREQEVKKFRQRYMGELPGQMQTILRIMDQLQIRLQTINDSLRSAKDREVLVQNQLNDIVLTLSMTTTNEENNTTSLEVPVNVQLKQSKMILTNLKMKYTDKHPDIKKLKKIIVEIEKRLKEENSNNKEEASQSIPLPELQDFSAANDPLYRSLATQLESEKLEILSLTKGKKKIEKQLKKFQSKVEKIPRREQQLIKLTRDYDLMKTNYQSLFARKLQAQLSENLEKKQKGEQFRILDPANFPERPDKPNRPKLILLSLLAGLGVGIGFVALLEYRDTSFYDVEDVEKFTNLPILAAIPTIDMKK